jgi:hypothetical protein
MAGPVLDLELQGGRWQLYRDPPRPPPVGVAVEGNGGDALNLPYLERDNLYFVDKWLYVYNIITDDEWQGHLRMWST